MVDQYTPQPPQPQYQQNYAPTPQPGMPQQYAPANQDVTLGDWVLTIFLTAIPLVGFIMLFVWGFGSSTPESKKNWARATLIWYVIGVIVSILFAVFFGALIIAAIQNGGTSYYRF
ncbi:MAG: hypothetical protein LBU48_07630 [Coriobacteriales bacterium]|jgi:hypothetical protein|nr:hypothetical protein [Coriobacteriales bacterium]